MAHVADLAQVKNQQNGDLSVPGWSSGVIPEGVWQMY